MSAYEPDTEPDTTPDGLKSVLRETRRISTSTLNAACRVLVELQRRTYPPPPPLPADEQAKPKNP